MKHKKSILEGNIIYTLFAILIGFLTGAIILAIAGMNPGVIYAKLFTGIFAKPKFLAWSVVYATPLIFTGLSVAFSFRTGVFNIAAIRQSGTVIIAGNRQTIPITVAARLPTTN